MHGDVVFFQNLHILMKTQENFAFAKCRDRLLGWKDLKKERRKKAQTACPTLADGYPIQSCFFKK